MFERSENSYKIEYSNLKVDDVLKDKANPLVNIVSILPENAKVLDIGAGNGFLGWLIKKTKPSIVVDGVEPSYNGSQIARPFYRNIYNSYYQDIKNKLFKEKYDYIVLADVIEHIENPYTFLADLLSELPKTTKLIFSVPNVAHGSVRLSLLNGDFDYIDSGLLEKTHLRFFTLKTLKNMISNLNMNIESIFYLRRPFALNYFNKIKPGIFAFFRLSNDITALTYQYLVVISFDEVEKNIYFCGSSNSLKYSILSPLKKYIKSTIKHA